MGRHSIRAAVRGLGSCAAGTNVNGSFCSFRSTQPAAAALPAAAEPTAGRLRPPAALSCPAAGRAHRPQSCSRRSTAKASAALRHPPNRRRIRLRRRPSSRRLFRRLAATPPPRSANGPAQSLHRAGLLARLPVVVVVPALEAGHRRRHRRHHHLKAPQNRTEAHQCSGRWQQPTEAQTHLPWPARCMRMTAHQFCRRRPRNRHPRPLTSRRTASRRRQRSPYRQVGRE